MAPPKAPAMPMASQTRGAGSPSSGTATAAANKPPRTNAPSPPITTRPSRAGIATHSAVSSNGVARCSEFCNENEEPKPPVHISVKNCSGE